MRGEACSRMILSWALAGAEAIAQEHEHEHEEHKEEKKAPAKEKISEMEQTKPMKGDMKAKMKRMK